jgi:hypothetical protein
VSYLGGTNRLGAGAFGVTAIGIASAELGLGFGQAVVLGIFCDALVCLAVWLISVCSSPKAYSGLTPGSHTFSMMAQEAAEPPELLGPESGHPHLLRHGAGRRRQPEQRHELQVDRDALS